MVGGYLIFNMWTLWLFGPTVKDRFGHARFLIFYFMCGIRSIGGPGAFEPDVYGTPALGASGAIAGVLGSFMGLFPLARVVVMVPIIFIPFFFELPAFVFMGLSVR